MICVEYQFVISFTDNICRYDEIFVTKNLGVALNRISRIF